MSSLKYIKISKLVSKVKCGDSQAFAELYSLTYQKVYFLALSILKDQSMAEDATQEVFINVLQSIHKLENPKVFLAWINKITYNYCINEFSKSKKLKESNFENILPITCDDSTDANPLESYIEKENSNELMNLISKLTEKQSTILILRYFEDLKVSEIAYVLNISEGTVKSRLDNARKSLHKLYISEKKDRKYIYVFLLYPFFKKASNDNRLTLNSYKKILNNILITHEHSLENEVKLTNIPKFNFTKYIPFSGKFYITLTASLICAFGIIKYPFNSYVFKTNKVSGIYNNNAPKIINYTYSNNEILIKFENSVSGINFNKIYLNDDNGKPIDIKSIDKSNNSIKIEICDDPLYLTVFDNDNNRVVYNIRSV